MVNPIVGAVAGEVISGLAGKLFGGGGGSVAKQVTAQKQLMEEQYRLNKLMAENSIQWRMADAKKAGVSQLAALGVQPMQASFGVGNVEPIGGDNTWGEAGAGMGRAIAASMDPATRLNLRLLETQIEGQEIDNAAKKSQLALRRAQVGPGMPGITGKGYSGGSMPMYGTVDTPYGPRTVVSDSYGQILENDMTEYLRYLPRDLASRGRRLYSSFKGYLGRRIDRARTDYRSYQR